MILWLLACGGGPEVVAPAPLTAVELPWPGQPAATVDAELSTAIDAALSLLDGVQARRCEATEGLVRCLVEAPVPEVQAVLEGVAWPEGALAPLVRPLPAPSEASAVLVLDPVVAAYTWDPAVWVHRRWPMARVVADRPLPDGVTASALPSLGAEVQALGEVACDGKPAAALWVDPLPQVPPPPEVDVRTWPLDDVVFFEGRGALPTLPGVRWCGQAVDGRVEGLVALTATEARQRLPGLDIVPPRATSRRYRGSSDGVDATSLRALPNVLAVRQVHDEIGTEQQLVVDGAALRRHGVSASALGGLQGARSVAVGDVRLGVEVRQPLDLSAAVPTTAGGTVPLGELATLQLAPVDRVLVRVDGERAGWVEVIIDDPAGGPAVDEAAAALGLLAVGDRAERVHRP